MVECSHHIYNDLALQTQGQMQDILKIVIINYLLFLQLLCVHMLMSHILRFCFQFPNSKLSTLPFLLPTSTVWSKILFLSAIHWLMRFSSLKYPQFAGLIFHCLIHILNFNLLPCHIYLTKIFLHYYWAVKSRSFPKSPSHYLQSNFFFVLSEPSRKFPVLNKMKLQLSSYRKDGYSKRATGYHSYIN